MTTPATTQPPAPATSDALALRRHALAERLLHDVIGLDWTEVHERADEWEGLLTGDVEAKVVRLLGDPGTCPHGNPIPLSANAPDQSDAIPLVDAPVGDVEVVRVTERLEEDVPSMRVLQAAGVMPGRPAEITSIDADGIHLVGAAADCTLPHALAAELYVRVLEG